MTQTTPRNRVPTLLAATALVVAVAGAGGPVVAAAFDARNADKVDGKHAVSAGAKIGARKNKLVATNRRGYLPDNIIRKAPRAAVADRAADADRLGGLTAAQLQFPSVAPAGITMRGVWNVDQPTPVNSTITVGTSFSFPVPLPSAPTTEYVNVGAPASENCPGTAADPQAAPGYLCVYAAIVAGGTHLGTAVDANRFGGYVGVPDDGTTVGVTAQGTWAVTSDD